MERYLSYNTKIQNITEYGQNMILPPLLTKDEIRERKNRIPKWDLINDHHLKGIFHFKNFKEALDFTMKVGEIAENMQHHPEIILSWGRVEIIIYTHDRDGLTDWDFVFAERVQSIKKDTNRT